MYDTSSSGFLFLITLDFYKRSQAPPLLTALTTRPKYHYFMIDEEAPTQTCDIVIFCKQPWLKFCHPVSGKLCWPFISSSFQKKKLQGSDTVEAESHLFRNFSILDWFSCWFYRISAAVCCGTAAPAKEGKAGQVRVVFSSSSTDTSESARTDVTLSTGCKMKTVK